LDGGEVPLKLLFRPAFTDAVGFSDAVAVEIFGWFVLMLTMWTLRLLPVLPVADCKIAIR
jgi:hypothetical protein